MSYISCFSGIGGLESHSPPLLVCDTNPICRLVLGRRYPRAKIHEDIKNLTPPRAEIVAGGWPCQDISIAGTQTGLQGDRSGLLKELLRVAKASKAPTLIAENVANLVRLDGGNEFRSALEMIHNAGFPFISWRIFNAREFGLPQHRTRLILVASKKEDRTLSIFREPPQLSRQSTLESKKSKAAGFYWTAGIHSINYSRGYVPTVKVGSALTIPSPPAVHYGATVRLITPHEALRLQGFLSADDPANEDIFADIGKGALYQAAGNAVCRPLGLWIFEGVESSLLPKTLGKPQISDQAQLLDLDQDNLEGLLKSRRGGRLPDAGQSIKGAWKSLERPRPSALATNLIDYLDRRSKDQLSSRAASGLLARLQRSKQPCPETLLEALRERAADHD